MKYKLLRFSLLSMLVMLCGGNVFADQITMKYSGTTTTNMTGNNDAELLGLDVNAWSVVGAKGGSNNFPGLNKNGDFRLYYHKDGSNTITVSSLKGATINSISMTFNGNYNNVSVTVNGNAVEATDGSYTINNSSFVLGNANTTNTQVQIKEVVINYTAGETSGKTATTVTLSEGYATSGVVGGTIDLPTATVKAGDATLNTTVTWTSSNEDVAKIEGNTINLLAAGTAKITASFAGDDANEASSASFTVTVAGVYTSLKALQEAASATSTPAQITFTNVVVTAVKGDNAYLADADGYGVLLYTKNHGLEAGQVLNGTITANIILYRGQTEITDFSKEGLTITTTELTPTEKTIDKITAANQSTLVTLKGVTYKDGKLSDGTNEITFYNTFSIADESLPVADKTYDITGIIILYNTTIEIAPRTAADIVEAAAEEGYVYRDFAVNLTNADAIPTTSNSFGVKVAEDGTYTAVAADDATANFTVSAVRFNDAQHGWVNCTFTIPVTGPVLIKLGDCQFGAQTGKITDAEGNVTELTKPAKQCWAASKPDENVVATYYRGLNATTLQVTYDGYCPFISVKAIDPADLPAEVAKHTVTFAAGEATGEVPAAVEDEVGTKITLPTNYTLYVEGKTLTAWSDGENTFAPGAEYTIPETDVTLTAVFTANEVSLADRTEAVTVKWNFRRDQGAPAVGWEGKDGLVWVGQATVNGKTIDVALPFSTAPGKFNNKNNTDWIQINNGTKFTVPSCKGAEVSIEAYNVLGEPAKDGQTSFLTIDGQSDYTHGKTVSYTIANKAETVDVVIGEEGSYYRYIQVVLPVVASGNIQEKAIIDTDFQDWTKSSTNSEITTNFSKENITFTYVNTTVDPEATNEGKFPTATDPAFKGYMMAAKSEATVTTTAFKNITKIRYRHGATGSNRGWGLKIKAEGDTDWTIVSEEKTGSTAWIEKDINKENVQLQWYNLNTGQNAYMFELEVYAMVEITAEQVTLNTAVSPEGAGSVSVYPVSTEFDKDSEVTLTATENFGYDFVNWTNAAGEEVSTEAKFKYTVTANETLTANFKAVETYELKLTVDGTSDYMVTIDPAPTDVDGKKMYEAGTNVMLTANQYEGLVTFTNWSEGETSSAKTVKMDADVVITAFYTEADIIAGWDFYKAGNSGRKADFAAQDNDADALNLVNTENGETSGWLDKSTLKGGGYESFKGAAVNWCSGAKDGDVGNYHWQTKVNAEAFTDIKVQFQMLYNYNAYQTYNAEYSLDGENWTKFGSITMTGAKNPASFSEALPEAANNQKDLYIRMIADKNSNVDGTASKNDGNTLAMFFITGTPKLADDPIAPALVSSVPTDKATGASATGKIVLNFDKKVQVVEGTKATLGNLELTPVVSGKVITFEYKGLDYATDYTFTLPANTVQNLTGATLADAITINFTTMARPTVEKGAYDAVVSNVDELVAAFAAAQNRADKNVRFRIFLKKGTYTLPRGANKHYKHTHPDTGATLYDGDQPDPITYFNAKNVSVIGEDRDATIITNTIPEGDTFEGKYGTASIYEGIGSSDVLQISGEGSYWQDVTISTGIGDALGRDIAIEDKGTKTIWKNTCLHGFQDTWVGQNDNGIYYFEGGVIRGRTDFICGKGDAYYNQVEFRQVAGGYTAVPSKPANIGWVMKDCIINGDDAVTKVEGGRATQTAKAEDADGNYTLGRPWGSGTPVALWIDTKMNVVPSAIGWNEMSNGWPKRFAEYNSTSKTGSVIDLSGRKKTFGDGHANNPELTAAEAAEFSDMSKMFGDWDPTLATEQAPVPANVKQSGNSLTWDDSNYALLWAVTKDGAVIGFTVEPSFELPEDGTYAVRAANEMGGLSEASASVVASGVTTGISTVETAEPTTTDDAIYTIQGVRVDKARKGLYIIGGRKVVIK
jgi:hypothetical protein